MACSKFIASNQKEESISIQRVIKEEQMFENVIYQRIFCGTFRVEEGNN